MKRKLCIAVLIMITLLHISVPALASGGYFSDPASSQQTKNEKTRSESGGETDSYTHAADKNSENGSNSSKQTQERAEDQSGSGGYADPYTPAANTNDNIPYEGKADVIESDTTADFSESDEGFTTEELYSQQYHASGTEDIEETLPEEISQIMKEYEITPEKPESITNISFASVLDMLWNVLKENVSAPMKASVAVLSVILLICFLESFSGAFSGKSIAGVFQYISTAAIGAIFILPVMDCVTRSISAVRVCGVFMLAFCPIYVGILIASGKAATAAGFQTLVFSAAQVIVQIASNFVTPIISMYMGISVASSVSPGVNINGFCEAFKKIVSWVLTGCMTLFVGFLGIQTVINAATDSVTAKTAKFFVGTFIPVVGSPLGDAIASVQGCLGILKSSVGIYAVISIFIILIPVVLEILLYQVCIVGCRSVSDMFGLKNVSALLKAIGSALSLLLAVIACCAILFIVSLAIVIVAKGGGS